MKNKVIFGILFVFTLVITLSCEKDDKWKDLQTFSTAYPLCGQYFVEEDGFYGPYGPYSVSLYNTSNDPGSVWVDNIYDSGIKIKASFSGTNFSAVRAKNIGNDTTNFNTVTINNGVVTNGNISYVIILYHYDGSTSDSLTVTGKISTGFEE